MLAVAVAGLQVLLTALFFMDLRQARTIVRLCALTGVIWILIMFTLTFCDVAMQVDWGT